jgi:drug/metabolite transporter (DMT)-like permease
MTANSRRFVVPALITAGILWGFTVPLSKLALAWMAPGWLAFARFALAAAVLMVVSRRRLRGAFSPAILVTGGIGYGGSVLLQNIGIQRTSVTHAALLIGATPVLIAILAAALRHSVARPLAWGGFALSLAGVGFIASGQGSGSTLGGDGLVMAAQLVSAGFTVSQARLLRGRDPVAVTGLQLMAAAVMVLPIAAATEPHMAGAVSGTAVLATLLLVIAGTVGPTALFAFGQSRVTADVAGAFLNIEPLVGALLGMALFADPVGLVQICGGAAIVTGIALSTLQVVRGERLRRASMATAETGPAEAVPASVGPVPQSAGPAPARVGTVPASAGTVPASVGVLLASAGAVSPSAGPAAAAAVASSAPLRQPGEAPSVVRRTRLPLPVGDAGRLARALRPAGRASNRFAAGRRSLLGRGSGNRHERGNRTRRGRSRTR